MELQLSYHFSWYAGLMLDVWCRLDICIEGQSYNLNRDRYSRVDWSIQL